MWSTSFVPEPDDALLARSLAAERSLADLTRELDLIVVGSAPERADGKIYNRSRLVDRGEVLGDYRKIHLFSPNAEHRVHSPGSEPLVVDTRLGRIGVVCCYDIRFPELLRYYFYEQVEILVVPAQWPEARANHWRALIKARANENELYVIGCNRTGVEASLKNPKEQLLFPGDSRIVDPMGEVLAAGAGETEPIFADLDLKLVRVMHRILPVMKDRRPEIYARIWKKAW
jgi:predicted amidohydrolase